MQRLLAGRKTNREHVIRSPYLLIVAPPSRRSVKGFSLGMGTPELTRWSPRQENPQRRTPHKDY